MTTFSIANISKRSGVPAETIRSFERMGLLPPALRSAGYRAYPHDIVPRVLFVRDTMALGFTPAEILALLELELGPGADRHTLAQAALKHREKVQRKIDSLERLRNALDRLTGREADQEEVRAESLVTMLISKGPF